MPCNHDKDPTLPHWHSILNTCYLFFVGSLPQDGQKVSQLEILQRMKFPHCCITKSDMRAHCNDHCNKGKVIVPSPFTQIFTTAILSTSMFYKKQQNPGWILQWSRRELHTQSVLKLAEALPHAHV